MFVFKSIRQQFYLIVGLLLLLFGITYIQLARSFNRLSTSTERVQAATLIDKEVRWLGEQFWKLRFWERVVQSQSHPDADQQFGLTIEQIKTRIAAFDAALFSKQLSEDMERVVSLLSQYEDFFNRLIQFNTEQRLNRTQLESNYQVLTSAILLYQNTELLKPLWNLDRFVDRYLATHKDSEYKALNMVWVFLQTKLSDADVMDERLQAHTTKFSALVERDFALEQEIHVINDEFDRISQELMRLFLEISQTMKTLSREAISAGEQSRKSVQQQLLISAVVASIALLLIIRMIAKQIIDPLRQMSEMVMQVKAGNDQARFVSKAQDEIAELGFAFNDLLDTIQQHRYRLEALVEERTEKLIETNMQLQQEVTMHQRTEMELQNAKEAAEVANTAKSVFLANMSHELRTPLNGILGFAQIMARSPSIDPDQQEHLKVIRHSGEHLLTLINQVLDLSKIEAGQIMLNEVNFDLFGLLDDVEKMFQARAEEKQLGLYFCRNPDIPRHIRTDVVRLRQVLINLLNNAIKFTQKGSVTLRVKRLDTGYATLDTDGVPPAPRNQSPATSPPQPVPRNQHPASSIQFEIQDTGPGIAPEEQHDLFKAFVQTQAGQESQGGTGLGLSISRKFVQLMGGDMTVESNVGWGSVFRFHIRLQEIGANAVEVRHKTRRIIALEPEQMQYRILIVDDRQVNRQLLNKLLSDVSSSACGFEIREASNGEEALKVWEAWEPHLIWMDIRMPVMNGYETTKQIKATKKGQATVIIALTAISLEDEETIALSAGCDDFLRKPLHEVDIFHLLHKYLGVRFVYEDSGNQLTQEDEQEPRTIVTSDMLAELPFGLCENLRQAAEAIDLDGTNAILAQLRPHNPCVADALIELVNNYRFDLLQKLLTSKEDEDMV